MTVSSTSSTSNTSSTNSSTLSTTTSAAAQQNQFLTLLVAQLNNQDPTNPMDNSQMTTQIAQINTVSGIQQLNTTMNNMAAQMSSMQVMQGTSLIGRNVLTAGSNVAVSTDKIGTGAFDLASDADKVTVQILSPAGKVVDTLSLGAMTAGQQAFQWDASTYTGTGTPTFKVTATASGQAVTTTSLEVDTVGAVSSDSSGMNVILTSGSTVPYSAIKSIL